MAMFYLMMFLNNNKGMDRIPGSASIKMIMTLGVVVIAIFAYIFLFYTNSFIIKRRKKEIGVYNILGMEKRHIAKVLAMETVFVAFISIAGGLIVGILFSKLALMLLYRILGFSESIVFSITGAGISISLAIFGILYFLILLYNMMQIKLANPIELLRGSSVGEKEPKTKLLMTLAGFACIGVAYYIAITTENPVEVLMLFFVAVILVIVGTYMLFTAGSIALLKALRKNKKFYYNKRHFSAVSGMLYRMKQNAAGLASICILSTMVLVMVSTTVSMFAGVDDELAARYPSDIALYSSHNTADVDTKLLEEKTVQLVKEEGASIKKEKAYSYFTMLAELEENGFTLSGQRMFTQATSMLNIVTRENFIRMTEDFTEDDVPEVPTGSVLVYGSSAYDSEELSMLGETFQVAGSTVYTYEADAYMIGMTAGEYFIVVDSDATEQNLFNLQMNQYPEAGNTYRNVIGLDIDGSKEDKIDIADKVQAKMIENSGVQWETMYMECRQANQEEFCALYGGLMFLGIFLGLMFLMVTVLIIFYKQVSEGYDDKARYQIMEKVGMSNEEVKKSIQSQVRMVFFLPIVTAAIHVTAAFPMIRRLLLMLNLTNVALFITCLIITILIFTAIYYVVFKLTSRAYYKIVGNQVR